jgi:ferrous iron transport protein B
MIMAYTSTSALTELSSFAELGQLFAANGWTVTTAVCVMLFSLFHWPCFTTLMTVRKESGSIKWAILAAVIPTALGMALCAAINLFGIMLRG